MIVYPNAKINIGLNVVERRADGYHNLETVFYPLPLTDALEVSEASDTYQLKVSGAILDGSPADNLVSRAWNLLRRECGERVKPVTVHLYKHIPTGAGLGGGSADAAFMLRLLNSRFDLQLTDNQLEQYATALGADCAFFVRNRPVFASGIGNEFTSIDLNLAGWNIVLVKPDIFVSTRIAYAHVTPQRPTALLTDLLRQPVDTWAETVHNDFEASVFKTYPEIAAIKDRLYDLGAVYAAMSGSGSAVYGLFREHVEHVDEIFAGYFCRQRTLE